MRYTVKAHIVQLLQITWYVSSSTNERIMLLVTSEMLTCETLSSVHHVLKKIAIREQHTCARIAPATQHQRHVRTRTCRQPPAVIL